MARRSESQELNIEADWPADLASQATTRGFLSGAK